MGEANAQAKGKGKGKNKGKGKGKARGNPNSVRDGPPESAPVRELAAGRHGADHWDDLRRAWAGYLSQPNQSKGGYQPHHHPHQQNHHHHHHPPGGQRPESSPAQSRRNLRSNSGGGGSGSGSGDHAQAGQKRKGKAKATNGTAYDGGERAAKRHKGNPGPSGHGAGAGGAAEPHPDFWYPDGSVIIEVGKTRFCLHRSTLQKNSTYFADAFQEKGGHQSGKRTQLPVYRVDETTAEDFASLLTVIEEPMYVAFLVPS